MVEEESVSSVPSLWASLSSWFTPSFLFLFLNLMIATIALISSLSTPHPQLEEDSEPEQHQHQHQHQQPPPQANPHRSPSLFQRLKSINFYSPRSPPPVTHFSDYGFASAPLHGTEHDGDDKPRPSFFAGSPSSVLHRLKSFTLYSGEYSTPDPATSTAHIDGNRPFKPLERGTRLRFDDSHDEEEEEAAAAQEQGFGSGDAQEDAEEEKELQVEGHDRFKDQTSLDDIYGHSKHSQVARTKSDTKPASGEMPTKLPKKMKKSASSKSAFAHFAEDDIVEKFRPLSSREVKAKVSDEEEDEDGEGEVDAKADDFINRFKQQLKLQRIDSIMRYKDMVNRGSSR